MMKRVVVAIVLGAVVGAIGGFIYELTDQRIWGWVAIGFLLGIVSQVPVIGSIRWLLWGLVGGLTVFFGCYLGTKFRYPIWLVWPFLGAVFGLLCPSDGLRWRIGGAGIGFLGGLVGIGLLPLITLVILPTLKLPTTFDYDLDVLGPVVAGAFIAGTTAWLKKE